MNLTFSKSLMYCADERKNVFVFIPQKRMKRSKMCSLCCFARPYKPIYGEAGCMLKFCEKSLRPDKKNGFWHLSLTLDYQEFMKMPKLGG